MIDNYRGSPWPRIVITLRSNNRARFRALNFADNDGAKVDALGVLVNVVARPRLNATFVVPVVLSTSKRGSFHCHDLFANCIVESGFYTVLHERGTRFGHGE